jgi:hypothetical protein
MSPEIQALIDRVERMRRELVLDRIRRFDLEYPVGHSERESRMPREIRQLMQTIENGA